jgi:S-adenosylmethionine:tRNA ribosyltransferase-isomerase
MLHTADFDFALPEDLIAHRPCDRRDGSRLLLVDRARRTISHRMFAEFPSLLEPDDLVVLNDVRVARARFYDDAGQREILRLEALGPLRWICLVKPGKRMRVGHRLSIGGAEGVVEAVRDDGARIIAWESLPDEATRGHLPLPHYMKREDDATDGERYQTVYARRDRSDAIAAPTAGLHFTPEILRQLRHTAITLHVGMGTFQPVKADLIADHVMHRERYEIGADAAAAIESAPRRVAVGTTVTRVLEHCALRDGKVTAHASDTAIFIHPPFAFQRVDRLLTNFHLPKSTLFMLVCAFAGTDLMREAYAVAVRERYRFYSYGDCMMIL